METTGTFKFSIPSPLVGCPGDIHDDDEEEDEEECSGTGQQTRKKRRLSLQQVRSLEKTFEVENKLEPERKLQLAQELGLQPRQVAVWFQNRRARWKTKQLERDYGQLKLNYECLKSNFDAIKQENQKLTSELNYLKEKWEETQNLQRDNTDLNKENEEKKVFGTGEDKAISDTKSLDKTMVCKEDHGDAEIKVTGLAMIFNEKLEGSESESSAIVNEQADNNNNNNSPHSIDSHISTLSLNCCYVPGPPVASSAIDEGLMEALCPKGLIRPKEEHHHHQDFRADANFVQDDPACNFFNVDDTTVTLPWWEWA